MFIERHQMERERKGERTKGWGRKFGENSALEEDDPREGEGKDTVEAGGVGGRRGLTHEDGERKQARGKLNPRPPKGDSSEVFGHSSIGSSLT